MDAWMAKNSNALSLSSSPWCDTSWRTPWRWRAGGAGHGQEDGGMEGEMEGEIDEWMEG